MNSLFSQPQPIPEGTPQPPIDDVMEWVEKRAWAKAQRIIELILDGDQTVEKTQAQIAMTIFSSKFKATGKVGLDNGDNNALQALIDGIQSGQFNVPR